MSTAEKVKRVAAVKDEFGLNRSLAVIGLPKSTWYYRRQQQVAYEEKYAHLRPALETIARRCPEYGYRRTTRALREEMGQGVNEKVVRRLHQSWDLALLRRTRRPKPSRLRRILRQAGERANLIADLESIDLFQVFYTDFTELPYAEGKAKAHFMPILDHTSRLCLGWGLGDSPNRAVALQAWKRAKAILTAWQVDLTDSILHQDQDSVYTSYAWTGQLLLEERMRLSFALAGARDNPYIESFFSRFKEEGHSEFLDAETLQGLQEVVERRIAFYNHTRYHSSLGNRAPLVFIRQEHPERVPLHI
jgi:putative transposase